MKLTQIFAAAALSLAAGLTGSGVYKWQPSVDLTTSTFEMRTASGLCCS